MQSLSLFLKLWLGLCAGLSLLLLGCETTSAPPTERELSKLLQHRSVVSLPLEAGHGDLPVVKVGLGDGETGRFVLDTGATLTAIYQKTQRRLGLPSLDKYSVRVFGMFETDLQSMAQLQQLSLGKARIRDLKVAVLDTPPPSDGPALDGLIGMDVLSKYRLLIDRHRGIITFLPNILGRINLPPSWRVIQLKPNPFTDEDRLLHFLEIRLGNKSTVSMLDTGSEYSMINWNTVRFPQLRALRRKLRRDWELEGAIGNFDPISKVRVENFRAGQQVWEYHNFIVLDFKTLTILGIADQPFVIAGSDLFSEKTMLIDFDADEIRIEPPVKR